MKVSDSLNGLPGSASAALPGSAIAEFTEDERFTSRFNAALQKAIPSFFQAPAHFVCASPTETPPEPISVLIMVLSSPAVAASQQACGAQGMGIGSSGRG